MDKEIYDIEMAVVRLLKDGGSGMKGNERMDKLNTGWTEKGRRKDGNPNS